jgi:hypothetical protein
MFPWNRLAAFLPTGLLQGVTSSGLSTPDIDRPLGEPPSSDHQLEVKDSREVSAYSTVFPELAQKGSWQWYLA